MDLMRFEPILSNECHLDKQNPILVGVSGGPDSLFLLTILHQLGYKVIVAHIDHQLRPESAQEADFVAKFADRLNVPFFIKKMDVNAFAVEKKISIEESARSLRYATLFSIAEKENVQALAVAHQADDQVETVLMHMLRGAGPSGMGGMSYFSYLPSFSSSVPIVRPILSVWRDEIEEFCSENGIVPCIDQTNSDIRYFRNRIRAQLIPELESYNSKAKKHIWNLSQITQEEDTYLQLQADKTLEEILEKKGKGFYVLKKEEFKFTTLPIKRRILRQIMAELRSDLRDINFDSVEKGINFIDQARSCGESQILSGLWFLLNSPNEVIIYTTRVDFQEFWPLLPLDKCIHPNFPEPIRLNDQWIIIAEINDKNIIHFEAGEDQVYFDLESLREELFFCSARKGERFQPFGMDECSQKISDFFINHKINRKARHLWPIMHCGDEVIWIVGLKRANPAQVTPDTKRVLHLKLIHEEIDH